MAPTTVVRPAKLPEDAGPIGAIDTSFTTTVVFEVICHEEGVRLDRRLLAEPLTKRFPLDDLAGERPWTHAWVAELDGIVVGFAASAFEPWNARTIIWHLYVDPVARRRGVGRALVSAVEAEAIRTAARHLWLETSSLNVPGAAAYRALGFSLTGVDATFYDGTPAEGEAALFFSRPLPR